MLVAAYAEVPAAKPSCSCSALFVAARCTFLRPSIEAAIRAQHSTIVSCIGCVGSCPGTLMHRVAMQGRARRGWGRVDQLPAACCCIKWHAACKVPVVVEDAVPSDCCRCCHCSSRRGCVLLSLVLHACVAPLLRQLLQDKQALHLCCVLGVERAPAILLVVVPRPWRGVASCAKWRRAVVAKARRRATTIHVTTPGRHERRVWALLHLLVLGMRVGAVEA